MEEEKKLDIRWKQRFQNYKKALSCLNSAVELAKTRELSDLEKQGLVQSFEFTHELSWKVLKDFLEEQGDTGILGSKDAVRRAFNRGIITDGEIWLEMVESRNFSSHTYDETKADEICSAVKEKYIPLFNALKEKLDGWQ